MNANSSQPSRVAVLTAYFMIYVVWGSTYFFIGEAMRYFPPYVLGAVRFTTAGLLLLTYAKCRGEQIFCPAMMRVSVPCGMIMLFTDMTVIMLSQKYISSSLEAVLAASTMIWITLFNVRRWRYNFCNYRVPLGLVGGFIGVALLYLHELSVPDSRGEIGVLIFLGGMVAWALGSLFIKYYASTQEHVNAWSGTAWQMFAAGLAFLATAYFSGEASATRWGSIPWQGWAHVGYLALFGSICAYTSYVWLLKVRPATEVATHAYANPFIAILLGACFGGEQILPMQWAGLAMIIASLVLINNRHKGRHRKKGPAEIKV